jgi:choline dehydrogenase-like flavoprotein
MITPTPFENRIWDLCVVGTGPVGMALALEFDRLGREVLVLESGGIEANSALADASRAEIADPRRHAPMEISVCRALGGTSWTWGGRCVAYDAIDWMDRAFVPEVHWPISPDEIEPWYSRAAEYLLCGTGPFVLPYGKPLTAGLRLDGLERWSRNTRVIQEHRERLLASERIKICLNTTVTGFALSADGGRVESLEVSTPDGPRRIKARNAILAMGGVETTRLLLNAQQQHPRHFGGADGPLGRYYMGHLSGKIANIIFNDPETIDDLDFKMSEDGAYYRRRLMLTAEAQLANELLNTTFWPDNPPFYDPSHGSGVLSSVFLALAFPPTGRRLLSEAIRLAHTGPRPYKLAAHLKNAILGAPRGAKDIYGILFDRFFGKPRKPGFLVRNRGGQYALHYHSEQVPRPESRIQLSAEKDTFGMARARVDLRYTEQDFQSVIDSHRVLDEALRANGLGRLQYRYPDEQLLERVNEHASDGLHQVGTTRMGVDPAESVVDANLKVHSLENLYVASSSVFPTTGQANSTLLAVAFGLRLAARLHSSMRASD